MAKATTCLRERLGNSFEIFRCCDCPRRFIPFFKHIHIPTKTSTHNKINFYQVHSFTVEFRSLDEKQVFRCYLNQNFLETERGGDANFPSSPLHLPNHSKPIIYAHFLMRPFLNKFKNKIETFNHN